MRAYFMLSALALGFAFASAPAEAACDPKDPTFICGFKNPEDLVRLPGAPWVVASQFDMDVTPPYSKPTIVVRHAPMAVINIDTHEVKPLYPTATSTIDLDSKTYPECKAPPKELASHGLNVKQLGKDKYRMYVVNHGERHSVEIVDVAVKGKDLKATWRGCLMSPEGMPFPNSIALLPNDGIVLSGSGVQIWHPGKGWKKIGDVKGSNGVETSPDGKTIYVNDNDAHTIQALDLEGKSLMTTPKLDFHPDNLRWGDDGALYVAGASPVGTEWVAECFSKPICDVSFVAARVDPKTLGITELLRSDGIKGKFGVATTTLKLGDALWIGSFRGDAVLIHPLKK